MAGNDSAPTVVSQQGVDEGIQQTPQNVAVLVPLKPLEPRVEIPLFITAFLFAAASMYLYVETTEGKSPWSRASAILSNDPQSLLLAYLSLKKVLECYNKGEHFKAVFFPLAGIGAYTTQIMLAIHKANGTLDKWLAGTATTFAGFALFTYSLIQLISFFNELCRCNAGDTEESLNVARNLKTIDDLMSYSDLEAGNLEALNNALLLDDCMNRAATAPNLERKNAESCAQRTAKGLAQVGTSGLITFSSTGYTCSAAEDTKIKNPALALLAGNALMLSQYVLNIKAGITLIQGIWDTVTETWRFGRLSNEMTIAGKCGTAAIVLLPAVAAGSYVTAVELFEGYCPKTLLSFLMSQLASEVIKYGTGLFNGIFVGMTACWLVKYAAELLGDDKKIAYLMSKRWLEDFREASSDPANRDGVLNSQGDTGALLKLSPTLFLQELRRRAAARTAAQMPTEQSPLLA